MSLNEYKNKRDFSKTREPKGGKKDLSGSDLAPIFVVQKHHASHLHYDFRLELDGVLKSWAVPKGIPNQPHQKRLAIETEDHPLEYANFEGDIPKGQYGGGTVEIWDKGTFHNTTMKNGNAIALADALKEGHASVWLKCRRLEGEWTLLFKAEKGKREWLVFKKS